MRIEQHLFSESFARLLLHEGIHFSRPEPHVFAFHTASAAEELNVRLQVGEEQQTLRAVIMLSVTVPAARVRVVGGTEHPQLRLRIRRMLPLPEHRWIGFRMATSIPEGNVNPEFAFVWVGHAAGIIELVATHLLAIASAKRPPTTAAAKILVAVADDTATCFPANVGPELN